MNQDIKVLALTLYGETRGEPIEGTIAVGNVIRNRIKAKHWPPKPGDYADICLAPKQFSCWNANDPNSSVLRRLSEDMERDDFIPDYVLKQIIYIAEGLYYNKLTDNINGAKNYLTNNLFENYKETNPNHWSQSPTLTLAKIVGNHIFLKEKNVKV